MKFVHILLLIFGLGIYTSCENRRNKKNEEASTQPKELIEKDTIVKQTQKSSLNTSDPAKLKFFFENSGSMNGYLNGHFEIKTAISRLLSESSYDSFNAYLINTQLYNFPVKAPKVTSFLTPEGINKGNIHTSDLNFILKTVLDSTNRNDISILVTDGIYSVMGDASSVLGKLEAESNFTARHFEDRLKKDKSLQTILIKLNSRFNGNYYSVQGKSIAIDQQRPYYLWIFGSEETIASIEENLNFSNLPGYKNHLIFNVTNEKPSYYSTLPGFLNKGTFRQHHSKNLRSSHLSNVEKDRKTKDFQFAVGVDLDNIPVENNYLLNKRNYEILGKDDYTISSIHKIDKLSSAQINKINNKKATHIIVLHTSKNPYGTFKLALKKQIPDWVKQTHTSDDTGIKGDENTTLGFNHLVEATERAYNKVSNSKHYIILPLTIEQ